MEKRAIDDAPKCLDCCLTMETIYKGVYQCKKCCPYFPFGPIPHWISFKDEYPENPYKWIYVTDGEIVECKSAYAFVPRHEGEKPGTIYIAWSYIPLLPFH